MKFQKIILLIVALIATNLSAFEPFTLSFTDRAENNKPNSNQTIDVRLTLVNRYTGANIGETTPTYQHAVTNVKTNAYGMFSVVFEPESWKNANFETAVFTNGYNNYALRIETKAKNAEETAYKQIGVLAIGNLINNTVVTEAISGPAKSNFKITINEGAVVTIPDAGESKEVSFKVAGFTPETIVKGIPSEGYSISIKEYNITTGEGTAKLTRKAGSTLLAATEATLIANNENGKSTLAAVPFNAYYGLSSGLTEENIAKPVWIITDGGVLPEENDIKTALNSGITGARQLELPNATGVGKNAFIFCSALSSVSLPNATSIEVQAFSSCQNLTSVSLPAATSIGEWAFASCSALSSVSLPAANTIGLGAFQSCGGLTSVSFGSHITSWGVNVFYTNGNEFTQNITLTFKTEQKTFEGTDVYPGVWTITSNNLQGTTDGNKVFVGKTFKEIILK